ncbi:MULTISPECIES: type IV secretory system conjugative DNA transfer family protein [Campylobacter]|uniref:type IV secretory system conjugative DNA transfer family protein n=1 Tax=Campylobacter TaxID=194 RepID=UPI001EF133C8|nr:MULTISPECIES: type IV secretory system conjugative DNA transfer family protein [unclassified Campylobacter]MCR8689725.1 type IV secretory system conjugative DNA transfer family protein [Campylobacter sp. RM9264]MCR8701333.1 type IV secretory system conjugative DNA transfer family protein [Campylobacter sp. RM12176]
MNDSIELTKAQKIIVHIVATIFGYLFMPILYLIFVKLIKRIAEVYTSLLDVVVNPVKIIMIDPKFGLLALVASVILFNGLAFLIPYLPKKQKLHGDAKFANSADVKKMGLYANKGIIVGKYNNKLLRFGGSQFVSLGAPTRTGKGVGIVIPNLMDWQESCVVQDIKQECFNFASKYRKDKLNNEVYLFNPFDKRTHRYNPLAYVDLNGSNGDAELTDLANIIYPLPNDENGKFFALQAQNLFMGLCYLCNDLLTTTTGLNFLRTYSLKCSFDLAGLLELSEGFIFEYEHITYIRNPNNKNKPIEKKEKCEVSNFDETWEFLKKLDKQAKGQNKIFLSSKVMDRMNAYYSITAENTRSSILGSFNAPLGMFRGDNMRLATNNNDFDFRDLRKKKMTIFIGITPDQLANAKQILNLFWQQLILVNTKELPQDNADLKHKVMLLMDEFTASGYLSTYLKGISFIAGYGLRSVMIYQSNSQLETPEPNGYGRDGAKTLLTNHACQIFYTPREMEDAEKLSKMLGNKTIKNRSRNLGKGGGGSESDTQRPLMLPQELLTLKADKEILKIDNNKPVMANKAYYYNDPYFIDKFKEISPTFKNICDKKKNKLAQDDWETMLQSQETKIDIPVQSFEKFESELQERYKKYEEIAKKKEKDKIEQIAKNKTQNNTQVNKEENEEQLSKEEIERLEQNVVIEEIEVDIDDIDNVDNY